MKRLAFTLFIFVSLMTACKKQPSISEGEHNAIAYAQARYNVKPSIDKTDTLLCADMEVLSDSLYDIMFEDLENGIISESQFKDYQDAAGNTLRDIYLSWGMQEDLKQGVHKNKEYDSYWRSVITVDGIRILMDKDGITPLASEKEFREKMNHLKFNNTPYGRYCDF